MSALTRLKTAIGLAPARPSNAWLAQQTERLGSALASQHRQRLGQAARSFEGAQTPAWTASWATASGDINDTLAEQLPTLRARAINLARNDEWVVRYLTMLADNVLGERGIQLQMRLRSRTGKLKTGPNAALEAFWADWGRACDTTGRRTWQDLEDQALASLAINGEYLLRWVEGAGPYGLALQPLPPQVLDVTLKRDWAGRRVRMGIEIDDHARPVAYWLKATRAAAGPLDTDLLSIGQHTRVPAEHIIHGYVEKETDQLRGIPWLTVGSRRLWLLHDFEEAAAVATSNAAKRQGFFVSPDGSAPPGFADTLISAVIDAARANGEQLSPEQLTQLQAAAQKFATTVPGQFDTIPQGYDFRPFESKWPDVNAEGWIKQQVRGFAAGRNVSYHTLGNDLEAVNYSSANVGIGAEREHYKRLQAWFTRRLHQRVAERVLARAPLYRSDLSPSQLPAYLAAIEWLPRTWQPVDPLKSAEADDVALRNKSTTRRRIWLAKGLDPDEMAKEVEEDQQLFGPLEAKDKSSGKAQQEAAP